MSRFATVAAGLLIAPALLAASVAHAHQAGDVIVRAGAVTVDPREDSSAIEAGGVALGGKATLDSNTQLGLNFAYMLTDSVGIELLAATPFQHDVGISGLGALDGKLGTIKHLPPTLSAIWYPMQSNSAFQPYVGAGVNFTWFFDEELSSSREAGGFDGFRLDNSWGLAGQVGADFMLTENVMLNAQVRYIDISTTGKTSLGGAPIEVDVDVDPWVYMVGLGYKF
ncbi:outer membrane beta-barrel protein [Pseudomonas sp. gcc21]|uniref:OmpW/AlkL family protein n=1 Tax=Pseudomonas sp. gcc21 TaxID=2726989 RepID=UPI0014515A6F|nr:OmpW family outer membrane protein [Pseudomonas sp. gcc21]QJD60154.1 outer membrane beta-barrel protein [Pseudomonas sp. gcc21]